MRSSCVTITSVSPSSCRSANRRRMSAVAALSRLPVGSSARHDRLVGERAGDRNALALAAESIDGRWSARSPRPTLQGDGLGDRRFAGRIAASSAGSSTFSLVVSSLAELKRLEHEPDLMAAHPRQPSLGHPVELLAGDTDAARGRPLEAAEQIQQGRLPAATRTDDRRRLLGGDFDVHVVHRVDRHLAAVLLAQPARRHHRLAQCHQRPPTAVQYRAHSSSHRRSACSRSITPSSSSAATEPSGSDGLPAVPRAARPAAPGAGRRQSGPDRRARRRPPPPA